MAKLEITEMKGKFLNYIKRPLKKILSPNFSNYIVRNKKKLLITGSLAGVLAITSSGFFYYQANATTIYHVMVDGEHIGTVNNKSIVEQWESQQLIKTQMNYGTSNLIAKNEISFEKEVKYKGKYDNSEALEALKNKLVIEAMGVQIIVDGQVIGVVEDLATAEIIFNKLKENYMPKSDKGKVAAASISESSSIQLNNIDFKENLQTSEINVSPEEILDEETMLALLQKGTVEEKIYTVQAGDTISEIAVMHGLTTSQIYQLNPGLKGEFINIGDELVVTAFQPIVTVETEETLTQIEGIPYKRVYKKDNSMFVNEKKVQVNGKEGKKEVKYSLVKENGVVIDRNIIETTVLEEPVDEIVIEGTKIVPVRGTGTYAWPTVGGVITSYFGPRWGTYHEGLDISGVSDRTIKAADNGRVIFAGWKGGYGNTVMIDHGNGIVTLYAHMSSISVSNGTRVAKGQKIGVMGSTGRSTGTHLHFEVIVNGVQKNPLNYVGK